ncbi:DUF1778 domain-containing protein [Desulfobotulus mexicanus]|uniref:DUF1778 domain-containing protein n=1 Tax=Desulfobotulus mexicanus TaxID=2586642 RepID=A0A5S5MEL1_9BACT|nr:DUF1778 domain-containing protein [Desulfobotulus mexicanus]TYT74186.1 DUF1778 domain-containing protein [Desulfobotulus mexicanus]
MTALPRITARIDSDTRNLLSTATSLSGMSSINSFVLSAAVEKAKQILEQERILKLSEQDASMLLKALDRPPIVHSRLKAAAERYESKA